jgi:serine/threonine-protein kinase
MKCASCGASTSDAADTCLHCGRNLYALTLGAVLAERYEIQGMLGQGGMGVVYRARDRDLDETVAIKVLRAEASGSGDAARRMRSEIKLARRIRHRNVCAIHEFGHAGALRFIAMECVDGVSLRQLLREHGPLPPAEAYDLAIQAAEGLEAIHDAGIIHRDLKAANVMVDRRGGVRLMDFGIAKPLHQDASGITATDQMVGTPEYMSPEQVRCEKLDLRSDLYSFGILVFEMFSGSVPFRGLTPMSVLMAHLEEPPPLDGESARRLPPPLVPVLRQAMAKRREDRPASAREMAALLRTARSASCPELESGPVALARWGALALAPAKAEPDEASTVTATPTPASPPTPLVPATARTRPARPSGAVRGAPLGQSVRRPRPRWLVPSLGGGAVVGVLAVVTFVLPLVRPQSAPAPLEASPPAASPSPSSRSTPEPSPAPRDAASSVGRARAAPVVASPSPRPTPTPRVELPPAREETARASPATSTPGTMAAAPPAPKEAEPEGSLKLRVLPWAEVTIDGRSVGTTPLKPLSLAPGVYAVRLRHPDFRPLQKRVSIRPGEAFFLDVDLAEEAFPLRREED